MTHGEVITILKNAISAVAMARHRIILIGHNLSEKRPFCGQYNKRNGATSIFHSTFVYTFRDSISCSYNYPAGIL